MKVDSGRVISGLTNWIIGDFEKEKRVRIKTQDIYLGDTADLVVVAESQPRVEVKSYVTLHEPPVVLTRTSLNAYSGSFRPEYGGFYGIRAVVGGDQDLDAVAVNYPREYNALDVDEDMLRRVSADTGSRLYTEDEIDTLLGDILDQARETSTKEMREPRDLWVFFAGAALILYFLDTAARRLVVLLRRSE
jgi:hypothetical protein